MLSYLQFDSAPFGRVVRSGDLSLMRSFTPHTIRSALVRDRDVHAIRIRARSGTFYWTTSLYSAVSTVVGSACSDLVPIGARRA